MLSAISSAPSVNTIALCFIALTHLYQTSETNKKEVNGLSTPTANTASNSVNPFPRTRNPYLYNNNHSNVIATPETQLRQSKILSEYRSDRSKPANNREGRWYTGSNSKRHLSITSFVFTCSKEPNRSNQRQGIRRQIQRHRGQLGQPSWSECRRVGVRIPVGRAGPSAALWLWCTSTFQSAGGEHSNCIPHSEKGPKVLVFVFDVPVFHSRRKEIQYIR